MKTTKPVRKKSGNGSNPRPKNTAPRRPAETIKTVPQDHPNAGQFGLYSRVIVNGREGIVSSIPDKREGIVSHFIVQMPNIGRVQPQITDNVVAAPKKEPQKLTGCHRTDCEDCNPEYARRRVAN